jgi:hypothetical protein
VHPSSAHAFGLLPTLPLWGSWVGAKADTSTQSKRSETKAMTLQDNPSCPLSRSRERVRVRARELRHASPDAERSIWQRLRARQLGGYKFRRQHPIGGYFADCAGRNGWGFESHPQLADGPSPSPQPSPASGRGSNATLFGASGRGSNATFFGASGKGNASFFGASLLPATFPSGESGWGQRPIHQFNPRDLKRRP